MFDYISISTKDLCVSKEIEYFCDRNIVTIESRISDQGELLYSGNKFVNYRGIRIILFQNGIVKLMFSLHKLYNDIHGIHSVKNEPMNHDTYSLRKLKFTIDWLYQNFRIDPNKTEIHQLEFGFNLAYLKQETSTIIDLFISYKGKQFNKLNTIGLGNGIDVTFPKYYRFKIYDKALQYGLPYPIIRIEYKALRIKPIEFKIFEGDNRLSKLLDTNTWNRCKSYIIEQLHFCIINDKFNLKDQNKNRNHRILNWQNPKYWEQSRADTRSKQKKALDLFIDNYGLLKIKKHLTFLLELEFIKMTDGNDFP